VTNHVADISIESVVLLAQQNNLPVPTLDISSLTSVAPSTIKSTFPPPQAGPAVDATEDPWGIPNRAWAAANATGAAAGPATASILSSGLPPHWWKGLEEINVTIHGQQGLFFNRFTVYSVQSYSRGAAVYRRFVSVSLPPGSHLSKCRYSEFVFLWDCLVKRYPFRLLPQLPPKRIGREFVLSSPRLF